MSAWAFVVNGVVVETTTADPTDRFNPALMWIPCAETVLPGWTCSGTPPVFGPPPPPPGPSPLAVALAGPLAITSSVAPAINGCYPIDTATQGLITAIATAINAGLGLPGGGATFEWPDAAGTGHAWPAAQFTLFAKAVMNYLYQVAQFGRRAIATPPSMTIALD